MIAPGAGEAGGRRGNGVSPSTSASERRAIRQRTVRSARRGARESVRPTTTPAPRGRRSHGAGEEQPTGGGAPVERHAGGLALEGVVRAGRQRDLELVAVLGAGGEVAQRLARHGADLAVVERVVLTSGLSSRWNVLADDLQVELAEERDGVLSCAPEVASEKAPGRLPVFSMSTVLVAEPPGFSPEAERIALTGCCRSTASWSRTRSTDLPRWP